MRLARLRRDLSMITPGLTITQVKAGTVVQTDAAPSSSRRTAPSGSTAAGRTVSRINATLRCWPRGKTESSAPPRIAVMANRIRFALRAATRAYLTHPWALGADAILLMVLAVWVLT